MKTIVIKVASIDKQFLMSDVSAGSRAQCLFGAAAIRSITCSAIIGANESKEKPECGAYTGSEAVVVDLLIC